MPNSDRDVWDRHWRSLSGGSAFFGRLASLVRRLVLARAVRHYTRRYFADRGIFVETGCGTGQASAGIERGARHLVALDISLEALRLARASGTIHQSFVVADLRRLPFRDGSVAGSWNLGVMEHFEQADGIAILRELRRVLSHEGTAILFWPPEFGSSRWLLGPIEAWRSRGSRPRFRFFPDEVNRLRSRHHARDILMAAGFAPLAAAFNLWDCLIHLVVVGRRLDP
jgi:SAM-dependent methyltransferase